MESCQKSLMLVGKVASAMIWQNFIYFRLLIHQTPAMIVHRLCVIVLGYVTF